ncbi:MAG: DUF5343 domain-containing protein [Pseudomonadota bacterium]
MSTEKSHAPAYVSHKSLETFFAQRRENGHLTDAVDKGLMPNFSGSTQNELLSALKFLKMVKDKDTPTDYYRNYITIPDEEGRKALMGDILKDAYGFIFNNPAFSLERGTTFQLAELFKKQGASGSTMVRGIAFFLAAAKYADIPVSPNIKTPTLPRAPRTKSPKPAAAGARADEAQEEDEELEEESWDSPPPGHQLFEIPIPIDRKVKIIIPSNWAPSDWDLLTSMLHLYISGWKDVASAKAQKDKGPTPKE